MSVTRLGKSLQSPSGFTSPHCTCGSRFPNIYGHKAAERQRSLGRRPPKSSGEKNGGGSGAAYVIRLLNHRVLARPFPRSFRPFATSAKTPGQDRQGAASVSVSRQCWCSEDPRAVQLLLLP